MTKMIFQSSVRQVAWKKNSKSSQIGSRTYDLLVTRLDSIPLSYWRLVKIGVINSNAQVKGKLGHVVQFHICCLL